MVEPVYIGEVVIPPNDPYNDDFHLEESYAPFQGSTCPVCGSPHHITYRKLMGADNRGGIISGDLSFKTVTTAKCMHCGHMRNLGFRFIRDI